MIHQVDETEGEDTNELSAKVKEEHMNQTINLEDIDRSHKIRNLKKSKNAKHQPTIMNYARYSTILYIY